MERFVLPMARVSENAHLPRSSADTFVGGYTAIDNPFLEYHRSRDLLGAGVYRTVPAQTGEPAVF